MALFWKNMTQTLSVAMQKSPAPSHGQKIYGPLEVSSEPRARLGCELYQRHSPDVLRLHLHVNGQQITLQLPSTLTAHPLLDTIASAFHTSTRTLSLQYGI